MKLYRRFDPDEETPVQCVGVHPLRWRPEWGEPDAMFREAEDADALAFARLVPEVQALVEAAAGIKDYHIHGPDQPKWRALQDALAPFEEAQ
jgi:hypothetical protein